MSLDKKQIKSLIKELEGNPDVHYSIVTGQRDKSLVNVFEDSLIKNLKEQLKELES